MLSVYGATGFVGSNFRGLYPQVIPIAREKRKPKTNSILYFISTVDNYNVYENITLDVETNLKVLCEVLDYCRDSSMVFNFISSWFVYGKVTKLPVSEETICKPTGFYSITKKCAEDLIISFAKTYGIKYRILRLCNVLGNGDAKASKQKNAITWMINELKQNRNITLYNNGKPIRDVMHVKDVCKAIKLVCDKGNTNEIYNIGSGEPTSIRQIMTSAQQALGSSAKLLSIKTPEFHRIVQTDSFWMDTTKLNKLGFSPTISLEETIKELCQ